MVMSFGWPSATNAQEVRLIFDTDICGDCDERMEAACKRALTLGACSYKSLESILKNGLDRRPLPQQPEATAGPAHANIRGPHDYEDDRGE